MVSELSFMQFHSFKQKSFMATSYFVFLRGISKVQEKLPFKWQFFLLLIEIRNARK